MPAHPKHQSRVLPMPTAPPMPAKKGPRLSIILIRHQDPHPPHFATIPSPRRRSTGAQNTSDGITGPAPPLVFLPDDGEEEWARAVHDGDVGKLPVAVVGDQGFDYGGEEGVVRGRAHGVVGDAGGVGAADPGGVGEEGVEAAIAALGGWLVV